MMVIMLITENRSMAQKDDDKEWVRVGWIRNLVRGEEKGKRIWEWIRRRHLLYVYRPGGARIIFRAK